MRHRLKITPGAEYDLDILAPDEYNSGVNKLLTALGQNAKFRRVTGTVTSLSSSGSNPAVTMGPDPGFIWELKWAVFSAPGATQFHIVMNDTVPPNSPLNFVGVSLAATQIGVAFGSWLSNTFPDRTVIIQPEDRISLYAGGATLPAGTVSMCQLGVVEVPVGHEAQLLL